MEVKGLKLEVIKNKMLPCEFCDMVRLLKRPYIKISLQEYKTLFDILGEANSDIFIDENGQEYTIGTCDCNGCYVLMPLIKNI